MPTPKFDPNAPYQVEAPKFDPSQPYEAAPRYDYSSLTHNPHGEGTYQIKAPDGQTIDVPYSNVPVFTGGLRDSSFASPDEEARFNKDAAADPKRPTFWNALTNPVGSGGREQGAGASLLQEGGQAIQTMAQPFQHPIATLEGTGKVVLDAVRGGPAAVTQDVVAPVIDKYVQDRQQGGNALAIENLIGNVGGNVEGGRLMGATVSGVKPSLSLGAAGEAPAVGAEGPVNTVGGLNRLVPELVRKGIQPSAWDFVNQRWHPKGLLTGDVNAPIPGEEVTPAARYESMKNMGLQPNAAEATNSTPLNMAERVNQNSLTAAPTYMRARAANLAALKRYTNEVLSDMSPLDTEEGGSAVQRGLAAAQSQALEPYTLARARWGAALNSSADRLLDNMSPLNPEEGGAAVQQGLRDAQVKLQNDAAEGFSTLDRAVGNRKLRGTTLQQTAKNIYDANVDYYTQHPALVPGNAWKIVKDLAGADSTPPFQSRPMGFNEVHQLRSDLLELVRSNPDIVKNQAGGWLQQLASAADQTMTSGTGGLNLEGARIFRDANEAWANMKGTYDNPSHPFYQAIRTQAPSTLVKGISQTPEMVKMLQAALGPEGMGPIQRGVAEKLLGTTKEGGYNFDAVQGAWNKLPEAYRNALFTPEQISQFENIGNAGTVLHKEASSANPSSSPYEDTAHPLHHTLHTPPLPSTLVNSLAKTPETVRALQEALGPKGMGPIQRGVAESLLRTTKEGGFNFKTFQGQWNKLPQVYRDALFTPEQIKQLQDIGNAGTVLHEDLNPSGSAKLGQGQMEMGAAAGAGGAALVGHPPALLPVGAYHAVQYALGKLMNSPKFVEWLMRDQGESGGVAVRTGSEGALPAAAASGAMLTNDPHTGPNGQPNYYSDSYLKSKAAFDAAQPKE